MPVNPRSGVEYSICDIQLVTLGKFWCLWNFFLADFGLGMLNPQQADYVTTLAPHRHLPPDCHKQQMCDVLVPSAVHRDPVLERLAIVGLQPPHFLPLPSPGSVVSGYGSPLESLL